MSGTVTLCVVMSLAWMGHDGCLLLYFISIHGGTGVVLKHESLRPGEPPRIFNALEKASPLSLSCSYSELTQNFDLEAISRGVSTHAQTK